MEITTTLLNHEITAADLDAIKEFCERYEYDTDEWCGIRFAEQDLEVGCVFGNSKHNPAREDERDFPEFGSDEYDNLDDLDGTSAWHYNKQIGLTGSFYDWMHCYIIASKHIGDHPEPDDDEILLKDARVIAKLF